LLHIVDMIQFEYQNRSNLMNLINVQKINLAVYI